MTALRCRKEVSTKLNRIAELAREDQERQFLSLAHLLTPELLEGAFRSLKKKERRDPYRFPALRIKSSRGPRSKF